MPWTIVLPGAGHMSMIERPDEVLEALKGVGGLRSISRRPLSAAWRERPTFGVSTKRNRR